MPDTYVDDEGWEYQMVAVHLLGNITPEYIVGSKRRVCGSCEGTGNEQLPVWVDGGEFYSLPMTCSTCHGSGYLFS